ncbi:TIGR01906 family membrane protein [Nesterenkonia halotolerans]|uniref:Integral membrane protein (TIGR01906 family) n=3 Tax=Nesterenkonia halotolerans TaxID=225325 RepID=A0ABR9JA35_9MICC|nr:TIGR01906 family membrane protein [Nesterenkonia halotolerans]MBE1515755.1 integral membrane protein (TIGR01906 family) [Nesterenkonia halotolerans]
MSANSERNEAGRPADDNEDFESGLDYGAFASEEPDFPEDKLSAERERQAAQPRQSAPAEPQQTEQPQAAQHDDQATQAMPAAREQQAAPGRHDMAYDDATQNIPTQRAPHGDSAVGSPERNTAAENPNATRSLDDARPTRETRSLEDTTRFTGAAATGTPAAGGTAGTAAATGTAGAAAPHTPSPTPATQTGADTHQPTENAAELSRREQRRRDRHDATNDDQDTAVVPATAAAGTGAAAGAAAGTAGAGSVDHSRRHASSPSHAVYGGDESITNEDLDEEVSRSKRGISRFFQVLIAIFTPILLLVAAVRLVASPLFLWVAYKRPWIPDGTYNLNADDRLTYGSYGTDFLTNLADSRYLGDLAPGGEALFTAEEVSHMVDVKFVLFWVMIIGLALLVITLILAMLLRAWRPGGVARGLFAGAWVTLGIIIAVAVLAIIDWQFFFAEFHRIFFADGTWTFPAESMLIQLYPEQFWIDAGIAVVALAVLFSLILLIATWPTKRRRARRAARLAEVHERRKAKLVDELNQSNGEYSDDSNRTRDYGHDRDHDRRNTQAVG